MNEQMVHLSDVHSPLVSWISAACTRFLHLRLLLEKLDKIKLWKPPKKPWYNYNLSDMKLSILLSSIFCIQVKSQLTLGWYPSKRSISPYSSPYDVPAIFARLWSIFTPFFPKEVASLKRPL